MVLKNGCVTGLADQWDREQNYSIGGKNWNNHDTNRPKYYSAGLHLVVATRSVNSAKHEARRIGQHNE